MRNAAGRCVACGEALDVERNGGIVRAWCRCEPSRRGGVVVLALDGEQLERLARLAHSTAVAVSARDVVEGRAALAARVLAYLVACASDGMRRPGSWERGWLAQAFGDWPEADPWDWSDAD
jgi:hypothetical protein